MFWHPETQKYYTAVQAQKSPKQGGLGIAGLNADNCEAAGFYVPVVSSKPSPNDAQRVRQKELPELVNGVWTKVWVLEDIPVTSKMINEERSRRERSGFTWNGYRFQTDDESASKIRGTGTMAHAYVSLGGDPTSLRWADPDTDFTFASENNEEVPMTAAQAIDFAVTYGKHINKLHRDSKRLKAQRPIPADFRADRHWTQ